MRRGVPTRRRRQRDNHVEAASSPAEAGLPPTFDEGCARIPCAGCSIKTLLKASCRVAGTRVPLPLLSHPPPHVPPTDRGGGNRPDGSRAVDTIGWGSADRVQRPRLLPRLRNSPRPHDEQSVQTRRSGWVPGNRHQSGNGQAGSRDAVGRPQDLWWQHGRPSDARSPDREGPRGPHR